MDEFKDKKNKLRETFPDSRQGTKGIYGNGSSSNVFANPGQYYAIGSEDEIHKKFKLILRSGKKYRIPYALIPIVELSERSDEIAIMAYQLLITITGRNLDPVEEYLSEEILIWLKESPSGKDDGKSSVFISNISIEGKAISKQTE